MDEAGLDFRRTQDIDMVLIVEALSEAFARAFWRFIEEGGYENWERSHGEPTFYRFLTPTNTAYPKMIERFARPQANVHLHYEGHLMPLHVSDEIPSLSAIVLDDAYYHSLLQGRTSANGITVLDVYHIIALKMKAWLDLTEKKAAGKPVNDRDIRKHRQDVFRLFALLSPEERITVPVGVLQDIHDFTKKMRMAAIDLRSIGISRDKDEMLDVLEKIYLSI